MLALYFTFDAARRTPRLPIWRHEQPKVDAHVHVGVVPRDPIDEIFNEIYRMSFGSGETAFKCLLEDDSASARTVGLSEGQRQGMMAGYCRAIP
jgi:hypothetical protein